MDEKRAHTEKGLYFNCDEAYSPSHRCKGKLFRMDAELGCLEEMCEDPPNEDEQADLATMEEGMIKISLQALSGIFNPRTLWLWGTVKDRELTILIDSGSTHNFNQDVMTYILGVGLQSLPEFKVFIGSGEYLVCREFCRQVPLCIRKVNLQEDLYVLVM